MLLAGTSTTIAAPVLAATARTPGSNETAVTDTAAHLSFCVTATNYYGESVASNVVDFTYTSGTSVFDLVVTLPPGALSWNIYAFSAAGASLSTACLKQVSGIGGQRYTVQGAIVTTTAAPPATDTKTGSSTRMEGIIPTLTGKSAQRWRVPVGLAGRLRQPECWHPPRLQHHLHGVRCLVGVADRLDVAGCVPRRPRRIGRRRRRHHAPLQRRHFAGDGHELPAVPRPARRRRGPCRRCASEFQNPITRSILKLVVHPWLTQGTALLMSYQLPQTWTNVANAWEMTCVQDYASIAWPGNRRFVQLQHLPVRGARGTVGEPFYSGILQGGFKSSDTTPFS